MEGDLGESSTFVEELAVDEPEAVLNEEREVPPEVDVGDHVHTPRVVLLVLDSHADDEVEEQRAKEDNAKNASNGEAPGVDGAGRLGAPGKVVKAAPRNGSQGGRADLNRLVTGEGDFALAEGAGVRHGQGSVRIFGEGGGIGPNGAQSGVSNLTHPVSGTAKVVLRVDGRAHIDDNGVSADLGRDLHRKRGRRLSKTQSLKKEKGTMWPQTE